MLENDTVKWLRDLDALNFLRGDAESAAQAVLQAGALGEAIYRYGQGFNAERGSTQQAADADKRLAAHWEALVKASKKPAFIDSGIKDLKVAEAKQESGWFASTLDVLNPAKWLLK
jgi:protein involved in temperature-dependent protein secretion